MDLTHISSSLGIVHPICIERGRNAEVWDEGGKHYIDFIGGIGVLNLGHGHPAIVEAVKAQAMTLMHSAFNALPHRGYLEVAKALNDFVVLGAHRDWRGSGQFPMLGEVTGIGAMRGIVFRDTPNATGAEQLSTLLTAAREEGLLLMPSGRHRNVLRLLPPLTTEPEVLEEGLVRLERALRTLRP